MYLLTVSEGRRMHTKILLRRIINLLKGRPNIKSRYYTTHPMQICVITSYALVEYYL